ncbi:MAG TPA: glycosyltransferase family 9 protein [Dokdonella sp.]|uniref:glycosyltransferase family 9 protein n=1 Tax=Dokdonella sp. TaxID=2291710 RepID=UPI002D802261|nr:glycosyltransferase family 9 protein [Dokdonella sp.]HET9032908.1 glycosyltransferase family 9 protein [Dokdonella sp.]
MLTPLVAELQTQFPGAQVDLLVGGDQSRYLFEHFPNVGTVYSLPRHAFRHPWRTIKILSSVRRQRYDLAIDPDISSHSSRLLVNRFRSTYRIGFIGRKPSGRLSSGLPVPLRVRHMAQLPIVLLRSAIATRETSPISAPMPMLDLRLTAGERASGQLILNELLESSTGRRDQPVIGIFTHATASKRYPDEWWSVMLDCLRKKYPRARFVELLPAHGVSVLGGLLPGYFSSQPRRMAAVIAATRMFIAADSGIMHLACASRGPVVIGLFSCTDPEVYGPYGSGNQAISTHWLGPNDVCPKIDVDLGPNHQAQSPQQRDNAWPTLRTRSPKKSARPPLNP